MSLYGKVLAVGVSWQLLYIKAYMFEWERRYGIPQDVVMRCARPTFTAPLRWEKRMAAGTYAKQRLGPTLLVFTCSLSDFFIEEADAWRDEVWEIIRATPHLTYQILSKRPERMRDRLPPDWGDGYENVWLA